MILQKLQSKISKTIEKNIMRYPLVCSRLCCIGFEKLHGNIPKVMGLFFLTYSNNLYSCIEHITPQLFVTIFLEEVRLLWWSIAEQRHPGAAPTPSLHLQGLHTVSFGRVLSWMLMPSTMNIHTHRRASMKTWMRCLCFVNIPHLCGSHRPTTRWDDTLIFACQQRLQPLLLQKLQT